jgi:glutaredoxin
MTYLSETCTGTTCLRLSIEPIPANSWLASLAKLLPPWQWDRIRRSVYQNAGYRCQICGHENILHCHEVWQYNEETGIQWLRGFAALCKDCHDTKHVLFFYGTRRYKELMNHFTTINLIKIEEAEAYVEAVRRVQQRLDRKEWKINYGDYNCYMPILASKQQKRKHASFLRPQSKTSYSPESSLEASYF